MKTIVDSTAETHAISKRQKVKLIGKEQHDLREKHNSCGDSCGRCGYVHTSKQNQCPAVGQKCHKCGKINHFAKVCKNSQKTEVNTVEENETDDDEDFYVYSMESNFKNDQWIAPIQITDSIIPMKLDTGADVNEDFSSLKERPKLRHSNVLLKAYD